MDQSISGRPSLECRTRGQATPNGLRIALGAAIFAIFLLRLLRTLPSGVGRSDFGAFLAAGHALRIGESPYVIDPSVSPTMAGYPPMLSAPPILPFAVLLTFGDPVLERRLLVICSAFAYVIIAILLLRSVPDNRRLLVGAWLVSLDGFWTALSAGQIYVFLALAVIAAWTLLESRPILAAALMGLVIAVKPNLAAWSFYLFLAGALAPALASLAIAAGLAILTAILFGPAVYVDWLHYATTGPSFADAANGSLPSLAAHLGVGQVGIMLGIGLGLLAALVVWRRRPGPAETGVLALAVAIIAAPVAWSGYVLLLLPCFFRKPMSWYLGIAGLLLALPFGYMPLFLPPRATLFIAYVVFPLTFALIALDAFRVILAGQSPPFPPRGADDCARSPSSTFGGFLRKTIAR